MHTKTLKTGLVKYFGITVEEIYTIKSELLRLHKTFTSAEKTYCKK